MSALGDARQLLADVLEPVLPGRVNPYATTRVQRGVAPYVWLESATMDPETIGTATQVWAATFGVHVVVDGATHAAMALLDDLISEIVGAVGATAGMSPRHVEPGDVFIDSSHVLRGAVVDVAVTITARSFCPPAITTVTVPPVPIPVTT